MAREEQHASALMGLLYKPVGALSGVLGGVVAGALFSRLWSAVRRDEDAPGPTEAGRSWTEVLAAATVQGAVYAFVKTAVERGGATLFQKATGTWPGKAATESTG